MFSLIVQNKPFEHTIKYFNKSYSSMNHLLFECCHQKFQSIKIKGMPISTYLLYKSYIIL